MQKARGRMMQYNRPLTIYTANSRKAVRLQESRTDVQGLFERLKLSQPIPVSREEYAVLPKAQQADLKDVGAYIAGELAGGSRRNGCVKTRSAVVLDADNLPAGSTDEFIRRVDALGACCCVHSTAKHSPAAPRLRVVLPLGEDLPADLYAPVTRLLCQTIQPEMSWFDPGTDQAGRIMYYSTHCQDIEPVFFHADKPFIDAFALLNRLPNWQDTTTWPRFPREPAPARLAAKQADPEQKDGIVGAFCRTYSIEEAMAAFIPAAYEPVDNAEGRYTYAGGSTTGGAVLYDDGKFLYSHHATDPCGGKLVNAFDMVRLHRFGALDDEAKTDTPANRLPSYTAMCELARQDKAVADTLAREAVGNMGEVADESAALELGHYAGQALTLDVLRAALKTMGVQVRRNLVTGKLEITGMPATYSAEEAVNTLPIVLWDLLKSIGVKGVSNPIIRSCLAALADENRYNPVLDMLRETPWDGRSRFGALLDMIRVDKSSFYALLIRKWLIQCVALAHNDHRHQEPAEGVITIQGEQGIGKTLLLRKLAVKSEWFAEGVTLDLKNKDDVLRAIGVWITELGELDSTLRKEQTSLKAFITQKVDRVRAPYAPESVDRPRHTSFGATVNPAAFLKDETGDRRFWVVPVEEIDINALAALPEEWVMQLWAEVYIWWQENPQGFRLSRTERAHLDEMNRQHRETLPGEEALRLAFDFDLPVEKWGVFSASELLRTAVYGERITAGQLRRTLNKLMREDGRITRRILHGMQIYRVPILKPSSGGGCG